MGGRIQIAFTLLKTSIEKHCRAEDTVKKAAFLFACCICECTPDEVLQIDGWVGRAPATAQPIHIYNLEFEKEGVKSSLAKLVNYNHDQGRFGRIIHTGAYKWAEAQMAQELQGRSVDVMEEVAILENKIRTTIPPAGRVGAAQLGKYYWPRRAWIEMLSAVEKKLKRNAACASTAAPASEAGGLPGAANTSTQPNQAAAGSTLALVLRAGASCWELLDTTVSPALMKNAIEQANQQALIPILPVGQQPQQTAPAPMPAYPPPFIISSAVDDSSATCPSSSWHALQQPVQAAPGADLPPLAHGSSRDGSSTHTLSAKATMQAGGAGLMEGEAAGLSAGGGENLHIAGLTTKEQHWQLAQLCQAHREAQAAREAAVQGREEAVRQKDEAERCLEEAIRQREEAVRQRDEAIRQREEAIRQREEAIRQREEAIRQRDEAAEDVRSQRAASAAVAAAAGPRVSRLQAQVAQLRSERDELAVRLEQLSQQQQQHFHPHQPQQRHPYNPHQSQPLQSHQPQKPQLQVQQQHPAQQQQQQQQTEESGPVELLWYDRSLPAPLPPLPADAQPQKRRRLDGDGGDADQGHSNRHCGTLPDSTERATTRSHGGGAAAAATTSERVRVDQAQSEPESVGDHPPAATVAVLWPEADAQRHHNAPAAALERREGAGPRRLQRLVGELAAVQRQAEARRQAEAASRLRAVQLERLLLSSATGVNGGARGGGISH